MFIVFVQLNSKDGYCIIRVESTINLEFELYHFTYPQGRKRAEMTENREKEFGQLLMSLSGEEHVKLQEPMKKHTTFRIGGEAKYFVTPTSVDELQKVLNACREYEVPYFIMGNGSNLLVSDEGYDGVVIQLFKNLSEIEIEGELVRAQAGALLSQIAVKALGCQLTGFEFAAGIPGTVGGAVVMNAGAYGGEMKDIVEEVTVLDENGQIFVLHSDQLELGYRTSVLQKKSYIALEVVMKLSKGDRDAIKGRMDELKEQRVSKQPLEFPSAGSTFKRPEGNFAGKLIMEAGFRGYQVGGARVSDKHCGFVINAGDATAADVIELTDRISEKVWNDTGIRLELEVRKLGFS